MRAVREARQRLRSANARGAARERTIRRTALAIGVLFGASFAQTNAMAVSEGLPEWRGPAATMTVGPITTQPIGHYTFCMGAPDECRAGKRTSPKTLTTIRWHTITAVNARVNAMVAPRTDAELHGIPELWSYPGEAGDCEDYALLKRRLLIAEGFAPGNLLITVVRKPDGEGHAVLTVRTERGDYVLDNLSERVRHWRDTPYRFLKRQASFHAGRWVDIEDGSATMVGAVE